MQFKPFIHQINQVRSDSTQADRVIVAGPLRSVVFPVSQIVNLSLITASGTRDFLIWHPYQDSVQDVLVGVDEDVDAPTGMTLQLIQVNAEVTTILTEPVSLDKLTIEPISLPLPGKVLDGPVFLRVVAPATALSLFVTIHAMTSEIR
tara:strand:- start:15783 stop:16226 length:444 start_codon:yes stop_codon:yes gene_type:complete